MSKVQNDAEQNPDDMGQVPARKVIEHKEDVLSDLASVTNSSQTIADMLSVVIAANVSEITLVVDPDATEPVHYNPNGAATAANGKLHPGQAYPLFGDKTKLDTAQFFAVTGPVEMSVFFHANIPAV